MGKLYLAVFELCSYGCTQIPQHSYLWNGYQFPLCARCLGVLLGAAVFAGLVFAWKRLPPIAPIPSVLLTAPLVIDGAMQLGSFTAWANEIRLLTGILFSAGALSVFLVILDEFGRRFGLPEVDRGRLVTCGTPMTLPSRKGGG